MKKGNEPVTMRLGELHPVIQQEAFDNDRSASYWVRKILKMYYDIRLVVGRKFSINGKNVYSVNLSENKLPVLKDDINNKLMGKVVAIDGKLYKVHGIEFFAIPKENPHRDIGIMVVPV
jgi:hypothetical protein